MPNKIKALFLAFSGVRIYDSELMAIGLTLPGFVERGKVIASLPSLSLLTIAAYCPDNWDVEYREVDELSSGFAGNIASEGFTIVAISSFSARIKDAYRQADELKALGVTVIMGGLHVTALPDEALKHADAIVVGEGELAWHAIVHDIENNELKKVYSSRDEPKFRMNFAEAKIPRFDLLDIEKYNRLTIQSTRGCPLDCSFCAASRQISSYKVKPVELVGLEIDAIVRLWPNAFLELADDNTFVNKIWAKQMLRMLSAKKLRWFTETDISLADDEELLELLAGSGCAQVLIGLESTDPEALKGLDTANWKRKRFDDYCEKIRKIQSFGISVNGCFILGFDSDVQRTFEATRVFVEESELTEVQATVLTPFPGTRLYSQLLSEGRILEPGAWEKCTLFDLNFRPKNMSEDEFVLGFRDLIQKLYSTSATENRRRQRRRLLRHNTVGSRSKEKNGSL